MLQQLKNILKKNQIIVLIAKNLYFQWVHFWSGFKWKAAVKNSPLCIELGGGPKKGENGWLIVDEQAGADIQWDLSKGIPLPDNSVDKIYSSHMLEHIPFVPMFALIQDCLRVLRPDGEFLVCVPDARRYIDAYINGEQFVEKDKCFQPAVTDTGSAIDQLNYIAYMAGAHKHMFDQESLVNILLKAGFRESMQRSYDPDLDRHLEHREIESIFAVARK